MKKHVNQLDSQGLKHGIWKTYWPNGTLWWSLRYRYGIIHGLWESYRSNRTLRWKAYYLNIK